MALERHWEEDAAMAPGWRWNGDGTALKWRCDGTVLISATPCHSEPFGGVYPERSRGAQGKLP